MLAMQVANKLSEKTKIAKRGEVKMTSKPAKAVKSKVTAEQLLEQASA